MASHPQARPVSQVSRSERAPQKSLALVGFMGSGKSAVGVIVAHRAHTAFFDLDLMIEKAAGMSISKIFSTRGEAEFRSLESQLLPDALREGAVAALGGGTIIDAANWRVVNQRAVTVYLELPFDALWERIEGSVDRPLLSGRTRSEVAEIFERRRPRYEEATHRVAATRPPGQLAGEILALWRA